MSAALQDICSDSLTPLRFSWGGVEPDLEPKLLTLVADKCNIDVICIALMHTYLSVFWWTQLIKTILSTGGKRSTQRLKECTCIYWGRGARLRCSRHANEPLEGFKIWRCSKCTFAQGRVYSRGQLSQAKLYQGVKYPKPDYTPPDRNIPLDCPLLHSYVVTFFFVQWWLKVR